MRIRKHITISKIEQAKKVRSRRKTKRITEDKHTVFQPDVIKQDTKHEMKKIQ